MITWLTSTTFGRLIATFLISVAPTVELRGGLPYGWTIPWPWQRRCWTCG